jgi:hypothetical protein
MLLPGNGHSGYAVRKALDRLSLRKSANSVTKLHAFLRRNLLSLLPPLTKGSMLLTIAAVSGSQPRFWKVIRKVSGSYILGRVGSRDMVADTR